MYGKSDGVGERYGEIGECGDREVIGDDGGVDGGDGGNGGKGYAG